MANRKLSELPVVDSSTVEPLYSLDEAVEKLAIAVHWNRENKNHSTQAFDLEFMYSLVMAIKNNRKEVNVIGNDDPVL